MKEADDRSMHNHAEVARLEVFEPFCDAFHGAAKSRPNPGQDDWRDGIVQAGLREIFPPAEDDLFNPTVVKGRVLQIGLDVEILDIFLICAAIIAPGTCGEWRRIAPALRSALKDCSDLLERKALIPRIDIEKFTSWRR